MLVLAAARAATLLIAAATARDARHSALACSEDIASSPLVLQRDLGRGNYHLSAALDDGDVILYQDGTWMVDNVEVGDGSPARARWARVDCVQINWTTSGEHGWIRATALDSSSDDGILILQEEDEVEVGPEQLLARVAVEWDEDEARAQIRCELPPVDSLMMVAE